MIKIKLFFEKKTILPHSRGLFQRQLGSLPSEKSMIVIIAPFNHRPIANEQKYIISHFGKKKKKTDSNGKKKRKTIGSYDLVLRANYETK
jgi:hypothetical protein